MKLICQFEQECVRVEIVCVPCRVDGSQDNVDLSFIGYRQWQSVSTIVPPRYDSLTTLKLNIELLKDFRYKTRIHTLSQGSSHTINYMQARRIFVKKVFITTELRNSKWGYVNDQSFKFRKLCRLCRGWQKKIILQNVSKIELIFSIIRFPLYF